MKVNENINLNDLILYGFEKIDKRLEEDNEEFVIMNYEYKYLIDHGRRGQFYYILITSLGNVLLYASDGDGSGTSVRMPDVLLKLITEKIFIQTT